MWHIYKCSICTEVGDSLQLLCTSEYTFRNSPTHRYTLHTHHTYTPYIPYTPYTSNIHTNCGTHVPHKYSHTLYMHI